MLARSNSFYYVCLISLYLSACAPANKAVVEERRTITEAEEAERIGGAHIRVVQAGDTLYGIAFVSGLDARKLAAWNNITDSTSLNVGQTLRLTKPYGFQDKSVNEVESIDVEVNGESANTVSASTGDKDRALDSKKGRPNDALVKGDAPRTKASEKNQTLGSNKLERDEQWLWPVRGTVVQKFDLSRGEQGINIAAKAGELIFASKSGQVVYVGNGLKGYGNLVILKHDDDYLSAYAHNQENFVSEGQYVDIGEQIASVGIYRQQSALHFQIRKQGDPVNPENYLAALQ